MPLFQTIKKKKEKKEIIYKPNKHIFFINSNFCILTVLRIKESKN